MTPLSASAKLVDVAASIRKTRTDMEGRARPKPDRDGLGKGGIPAFGRRGVAPSLRDVGVAHARQRTPSRQVDYSPGAQNRCPTQTGTFLALKQALLQHYQAGGSAWLQLASRFISFSSQADSLAMIHVTMRGNVMLVLPSEPSLGRPCWCAKLPCRPLPRLPSNLRDMNILQPCQQKVVLSMDSDSDDHGDIRVDDEVLKCKDQMHLGFVIYAYADNPV